MSTKQEKKLKARIKALERALKVQGDELRSQIKALDGQLELVTHFIRSTPEEQKRILGIWDMRDKAVASVSRQIEQTILAGDPEATPIAFTGLTPPPRGIPAPPSAGQNHSGTSIGRTLHKPTCPALESPDRACRCHEE